MPPDTAPNAIYEFTTIIVDDHSNKCSQNSLIVSINPLYFPHRYRIPCQNRHIRKHDKHHEPELILTQIIVACTMNIYQQPKWLIPASIMVNNADSWKYIFDHSRAIYGWIMGGWFETVSELWLHLLLSSSTTMLVSSYIVVGAASGGTASSYISRDTSSTSQWLNWLHSTQFRATYNTIYTYNIA